MPCIKNRIDACVVIHISLYTKSGYELVALNKYFHLYPCLCLSLVSYTHNVTEINNRMKIFSVFSNRMVNLN